ncbi:MAG: 30S ribosomal protein S6 [Planctomycetaceae bacterium]
MTENLYEGMFLLDSGKFAADHDGTANQVIGILEKAGATVVAHRPWQDGRLAYAIDGHRKGVHYLSYFRMKTDGLKDVTRACKLSDVIIRHLIIKQPLVLFDAMVAALSGHEVRAALRDEPEPVREIEVPDVVEAEEE